MTTKFSENVLDSTNAFELLIATILSAQCTDAMVNQVTPALFARYPDAASLLAANGRSVAAVTSDGVAIWDTKTDELNVRIALRNFSNVAGVSVSSAARRSWNSLIAFSRSACVDVVRWFTKLAG